MILDDTGRLYSFGDNRYGQLGIPGLDNIILTHPAGIQLYNKKAKDFACGEEHAAYVNEDGEAYSWGYGRDGQLGHGDNGSLAIPRKVQIGEKVEKVACGGSHTAFITSKNELWMCGKGRDGQLGRGESLSNASENSPVKMADLKFDGQKVVIEDVALGNNHSIALGYINN